jgi:hypothetical protein
MSEQILNKRQKKMEVLSPEAGMIETKMKQGLSTPAGCSGGMRQARTFRFRQERFVPCQNVLFQVYTFDQNTTLI